MEFDFKVVVYDHDKGFSFSGGNDHVDTLTQRMVTQPEQNYITKHRTRYWRPLLINIGVTVHLLVLQTKHGECGISDSN